MRKCPICHKPTQEAFAPFCSARCQAVDLNRWLSGGYALPSTESASPEEIAEELTQDPSLIKKLSD